MVERLQKEDTSDQKNKTTNDDNKKATKITEEDTRIYTILSLAHTGNKHGQK